MSIVVVAAVTVLAGLLGPAAADDVPPSAPPDVEAPISPVPVPEAPAADPAPAAPSAPPAASTTDPGSRPGAAGAGAGPGERPDRPSRGPTADAAPALNPGYVDQYATLWKRIQRGQNKVKALSEDMATAASSLSDSRGELALATRERHRSDANLTIATEQFDLSVRDLYITGSTDVDVMLGVMGSEPDEFLRNLSSIVYLRAATGNETLDYQAAALHATVVDSATSSIAIRTRSDAKLANTIRRDLARAKRDVTQDQEQLQALIAQAAPQTVVGKDGCPRSVLDGTVPVGVDVRQLCKHAVKNAVSPQAAVAVKWAMLRLGAPYACEGIGRLDAWRYDCSSYVSRAYAEGAGLGTAGDGWAPSTRDMLPWDGADLDPHYMPVPPNRLKPGDLVLYDTCPEGEVCPYRHVVMYLGPQEKGGVPMMAHTNSCGGVAHVTEFWGTDAANFLGARRVMALPGETLTQNLPKPGRPRS